MALANYTDLKASIATWMPRADLTSTIPDCIAMAEADFNKRLRTLEMETRTTLSISGEYVAVPADWLEFRSGYIDLAPRRPLHYLSSDMQSSRYDATSNSTAGPVYFSLAGGYFRFAPTPTVVNATILYYAKIPPMASNATNWLLTAHPQLYLMESLFWAAVLTKDAESATGYKQIAEALMSEANGAAAKARWGGPAMQARAA